MQEIKVMHSGDTHLGFRQYGFVAREGDFYSVVMQMFKKAIEEGFDAILFSGDTFDSTKPPSMAVKVLQQLVGMAKLHGIRVLAIDGNHDPADGNWMEVCGVEPIGGKVVTIISKDGSNSLKIGGIDACRPAHFVKVLDTLAAQLNGRPMPVLAIHQSLAEMSDFSAQDYSALQMAGWVAPLGVQYVAMGDIHTYRETVVGGVRFAYAGSPEMKAIDEDANKSVSYLTYDGTTVRTGIIPLNTRPFLVCNIDTQEGLDNLIVNVQKCAVPPVVIAWYPPELRDMANRAELTLKSMQCMYRLIPVGKKDAQNAQQVFERGNAMMQLKDAVQAYFDEGTDEFQLVFQLLNAPDNVKETIAAFLKSKGL